MFSYDEISRVLDKGELTDVIDLKDPLKDPSVW